MKKTNPFVSNDLFLIPEQFKNASIEATLKQCNTDFAKVLKCTYTQYIDAMEIDVTLKPYPKPELASKLANVIYWYLHKDGLFTPNFKLTQLAYKYKEFFNSTLDISPDDEAAIDQAYIDYMLRVINEDANPSEALFYVVKAIGLLRDMMSVATIDANGEQYKFISKDVEFEGTDEETVTGEIWMYNTKTPDELIFLTTLKYGDDKTKILRNPTQNFFITAFSEGFVVTE